MTRHTLRGPLALLAVAWLAVALAAVPAGAGATAGQAANDTTLAVADATVEPNDDARARVTLDEVPAGLAGYEVTLELRSQDVATVTGASYPDAYRPTTDPDIGPDGRTVTLEAADIAGEVEPGATNVTLATVTVSGVESGTTEFVVTDLQVDADDGSRVDPALDPGAVRVDGVGGATVTATANAGDATPTDGRSAATEASTGGGADPAADTGTPASTTTGSGPGFGPVAALVALAALAALARRD